MTSAGRRGTVAMASSGGRRGAAAGGGAGDGRPVVGAAGGGAGPALTAVAGRGMVKVVRQLVQRTVRPACSSRALMIWRQLGLGQTT
jgi:hypothetical protein